MKRLLCITLSAILLAAMICQSALAVPVSMGSIETVDGYIPSFVEDEGVLSEQGGVPVSMTPIETFEETNTDFPTPDNAGDAMLLSSFEGEGTQQSPYLISDKEDLVAFSAAINSGSEVDAYYKLTSDIDLEGEEWIPVGYYTEEFGVDSKYDRTFRGVFDGDGHTVSNITITEAATYYIGFFGYIYNGTVKNVTLDNLVINIDADHKDNTYIGGIVGRSIAHGANEVCEYYNCKVINSSITAANLGSLYVGGIAGIALSGPTAGTETRIIFAEFDGDITVTPKATEPKDYIGTTIVRHTATAGGIVGYYGAESYSTIKLKYSNASCDVLVDSLDFGFVAPYSACLVGELVTYDGVTVKGGTAEIEGCFTEGTAVVKGVVVSVAGGMFALLHVSKGFSATNCYSTADVSGQSKHMTLSAGGFVGLLQFEKFSNSYPKTITNCYATGDAIDLAYTSASKPESSYVGPLAGFDYAGLFKNCYKFDFQVMVGTDKPLDDAFLLTAEQAENKDSYNFDFENVWEISSTGEYKYPTLKEKTAYARFVNDGSYFRETFFEKDGLVTAPDVNPTKAPTIDKFYTFAYWSLEENGDPFYFKSQTLPDSAEFYAVYTESVRTYSVSFYADGSLFLPTSEVFYGSPVTVPEAIPTKEETDMFRYEFLHWSDMENGEEFDFSNFTVESTCMFFAVFKEIDKTAWEGGIATEFARGVGSEALPYVITNSNEFALFAKVIASGDEAYSKAYYELGADINLGDNAWYPIGSPSYPFSGHFDGKGFMIKKFVITPASDYAGLFGYVYNGTIKNIYLSDFEVNYSRSASGRNVYAGALVGYARAYRGKTEISGIRVSGNGFDARSESTRLFAGNVLGFGTSKTDGQLLIKDCFATSGVSATNTAGQVFVGGIAGEIDTESAGNSCIKNCYNLGDVNSKAYGTSYAGGVAGYIYTYGTGYIPIPKPSATLSAVSDLMLDGCFAISNVSSESEKSDSFAGRIVSGKSEDTKYTRIVYPDNINVTINVPEEDGYVYNIGTGVSHAVLTDDEWLSDELGFDFTNVWTFTPDFKYPVLSSIVLDKPGLRVLSLKYDDEGNLTSNVRVLETEHDFIVVFSVYNANGQLIKVVRNSYDNSDVAANCEYSFEKLANAHAVTICAIDKYTLSPIYNAVSYEL